MNAELLEKLKPITTEEQELLSGRSGIDRSIYMHGSSAEIDRELLLENQPEIVSTMDISWENYDMYIRGMRKVVTELGGTARKYFGGREDPDGIGNFPVAVCAKTGTAEHSSGGSDHGAFVCFAPMENPEIAIAIYGEKVAHGSSLAPVAETILKTYFEMVDASEVYTYENQLG